MPGYLTSTMILIEADRWLGDVQATLGRHASPTPLDKKVLDLATRAREYLRFQHDPAGPAAKLPPPSPAEIENGVGRGISRFAYAGALGPEFPAAGHILALNQGWAGATIRRGTARAALKNAGSTSFVLNALTPAAITGVIIALNKDNRFYPIGEARNPDQQLVAAFKRPLMATMLGHLAGVATRVVLQPFVNARVWADASVDRHHVEVQLEARVAHGYFQRDDLHSGQSWSDYFLDNSLGIEMIAELYADAFRATYPEEPSESLCAFPPVAELRARFPPLGALLDAHPILARNLARYRGYDHLLDGITEEPAGTLLRSSLEEIDGLKSFLKDYFCAAPSVDREFLVDGYNNARNWAIDAGYDHDPWPYRLLLGAALVGATSVMFWIFLSEHFDPIDTERIAAWRAHGFFANEWLICDTLDQSYSFAGYVLGQGLGSLLNFPIPIWDGLFGQGTAGFFDRPGSGIAFTIGKYIYTGAMIVLKLALESAGNTILDRPIFRWSLLGVDFGLDILDNLAISKRVAEKGIEGDELSYELWLLQWIFGGVYFLSCAFTFGLKSGRNGEDGQRESGVQALDYVLGMSFVTLGYIILAPTGLFDNRLLRNLLGVSWPETTTTAIDPYLPTAPDGPGRVKFTETGAQPFVVSLFKEADLIQVRGQPAYPQDDQPGTAWIDRPAHDEQARRNKAVASQSASYTLPRLFKRASYLAGLLMMAAVNHDSAGPQDKEVTRRIFQDWNLDFRTVEEWDALMERGPGDQVGLARALEEWWEGGSRDAATLAPLEQALNLRPGTAGGGTPIGLSLRYEDGTPMANAEVEAVFGDQRVSARTDESGATTLHPPAGHGESFRLYLVSFPQEFLAGGRPA